MASNRLLSQYEVTPEMSAPNTEEGPLPGSRKYYLKEAARLGIAGFTRLPKAELVNKVNEANAEHGAKRTVAKRAANQTPERGVASSGPRVSHLPAEVVPPAGEADDFDSQLAELQSLFAQLETEDQQPMQMAQQSQQVAQPQMPAPYAPTNRLLAQ